MIGLRTLPTWAWITSHMLFILSLVFATICLRSILPHAYANFAIASIWCFAGGLCFLLAQAFAKLVAR